MNSTYIAGPSVCGFFGAFEQDYGTPPTGALPRVTPSRVGDAILPFNCPSCDAKIDFSDRKKRESYHDTRVSGSAKNDNYWCPGCAARFKLNLRGKKFNGAVDNGVAPSTVEMIAIGDDGLVDIKRIENGPRFGTLVGKLLNEYVVGSDIIGSC